MKFLFAALLLFINISSPVMAQTEKIDEKMSLLTHSTTYSWAYRNMFLDSKVSSFTEYLIIPTVNYTFLDTWGSGTPKTVDYIDKGLLFTIASGSLEPRINLISNSNSALHLKFPLTFGFSIVTEGGKYNNLKNTGFFHFSTPVLIGYAHGLNSTYSNADRYGYSISAGVQYMKAPLTGGIFHQYVAENYVSIGDPIFTFRKNWFFPLMHLDFFRLTKNQKIRGYSCAFSLSKPIYFSLSLKFILTKK